MADSTINRKELYKQFRDTFPIEYLKQMPLEKYTNLKNVDGEESFCYWVEIKTRELGSIKGGTSYKFGIYKYMKGKRPQDTTVQSDDTYAWYKWYDKATAQEAYAFVRDAVVRIAELASKGDFDEIEKINVFGDGFKWKIAFLYSNETIIPIYNRDWLNIIAEDMGMENPKAKSFWGVQQFLMSQRKGQDIFEYEDNLLLIKDKLIPSFSFKDLKSAVKKRLENDNILKAYTPGDHFLWIGTSDDHLHSDDCHYELCWDKNKKAGHDGKTVFVEMHCEKKKTAYLFEHLKEIDGILDFPWGKNCLGIRLNNEGWKASEYTIDELTEILVEELYNLHDLVGNQAISIEEGIKQSDKQSSSLPKEEKYQYYINLLKNTHNLVLTGAPGTGKTYMAQQIAEAMHAETKFVQFHPSYDYTDFVEGLRPIEKEEGQMSFERRDGVFKAFCKAAVKNIEDSQKSQKELKEEKTLEEKYNELVEKIENGEIQEIPLKTEGKAMTVVRISENNNIILRTFGNTDGREYTVSFDRLAKLAKVYPDIESLNAITNIYKAVTAAILGCHSSSYWAVLNELYKQGTPVSTEEPTAVQKKPFVFIIDEINRGEASKIFGELFYAIDPGYRGMKDDQHLVQTQYQNLVPETDVFAKGFYVPENVYILATMNDIDRSVESMDFAMRRRFTWHEVTPDKTESMLDELPCADEAKERMHRLNNAIAETDGLGAAYMIGPSYFLKLGENGGDFDMLWEMNIEPLLKEYLRGFRKSDEILEKFRKAYVNDSNEKPDDASDLLD